MRIKVLLTAVAVVAIFIGTACASSGRNEGTPEVPSPTATAVAATATPRSTPTPQPTRRPNTTEPLYPTPTPVDYIPPTLPAGEQFRGADVLGLSPDEWTLNGLATIKHPPAVLEQTSDPIDSDTVIELWTEYLRDTRFVVDGTLTHMTGMQRERGDFDLLFCGAGYGVVVAIPPEQIQTGVGSIFEWEIEHSVASAWWSPTLKLTVRDQEFIPAYATFDRGRTRQEVHRRSIFIVGDTVWVDGFLLTELPASILDITDPSETCFSAVPDGDRWS